MKSAKLKRARKDKNDEFYTLREDVIEELDHYKEQLKGKRVYLNCDDPSHSEIWKYLEERFEDIGLESLTATNYHGTKTAGKRSWNCRETVTSGAGSA